jgi:hypothetical protein
MFQRITITMRRLSLFFFLPCFLLCSPSLFASTAPNPADYMVNIHVTASRVEQICQGFGAGISSDAVLLLNATIDGVKYQLQGNIQNHHEASNPAGLKQVNFLLGKGFLSLGDYKAKLMPADPKNASYPYYVIKNYEILLQDGRLAEFQVIGQTE